MMMSCASFLRGSSGYFRKETGTGFSVDSILLADFARQRASGIVADLGTGSGVLPIILSKSQAVKEIIGIEVQENLARLRKKIFALISAKIG